MQNRRLYELFIAAIFLTAAAFPQTSGSSRTLTDGQKLGRRIFQQRCSICHTPPMVISRTYGPALSKETVEGREDSVRLTIREGETGLMPGFRYALEPAEISAIIDYLKTVEKPQRTDSWVGTR